MIGRVLQGETYEDHVERGIGQYFWSIAERYGERIFQINASTEETESFSSVKIRAVRVALHLQKLGISKDDVVLVCDNVNMDNIIPITAVWLIGAIPAPVYADWEDYYVIHAVENIKPKAIISSEEKLSTFKKIYDPCQKPTPPICSTQLIRQISLEKTDSEEIFRPVKVDPKTVGYIFFSSGTTAIPKAFCTSHFSLLSGPCEHRRNRGDSFVVNKPIIRSNYYNWISSAWTLINNIMFAQPSIPMPPKCIIDVLEVIEKYKIEDLMLVHNIVEIPSLDPKTIEKFDLSSIRNVFFGSCRVSPLIVAKVKNMFQNANIFTTYASTEMGTTATLKYITDTDLNKKLISSGKPTGNVKIKIVNPMTEELLGPNEKGEIRVKSPYRILSIIHDTERTSNLFDKEGFLKTKDLGFFDEDGDLYVIGRLGNTFKYKGRFYHPEDVEAVLSNHPAIEDAVIFPIEHATDGNRAAACIKLRKDQRLSEQEISDYVATEMSEFYRPLGGIRFFDSFPKTSSGKVSLMELKKILLAGQVSNL